MKFSIDSLEDKTVGELVAEDYRRADVFKKSGIDFCCGGKVTLKDVCHEKQLELEKLADQLQQAATQTPLPETNYAAMDLDALAEHILSVHHKYVSDNMPLVLEYTQKTAEVHGSSNPETKRIADLFSGVAMELQQHMMKEENILFPYIIQLGVAKRNGTAAFPPPFGTIANPINMMEMEHVNAGSALKEISELSNGYVPPENACNTFTTSYLKLKEFEEDLHLHIHLENNILFPASIKLEKELIG